MQRMRRALLVVVSGTLSLSACGGDDTSDTTGDTSTTAPTSDTSSEASSSDSESGSDTTDSGGDGDTSTSSTTESGGDGDGDGDSTSTTTTETGGDGDGDGDGDGGDGDAGDGDGGDGDTGDGDTGDGDTGGDGDGDTGSGDCIDNDLDGYGVGPDCIDVDCDDNNGNAWTAQGCATCVDEDNDDHYVGCDAFDCPSCTLPPDCDDNNPAITQDTGAPEVCDGVNNNCIEGVDAEEVTNSDILCDPDGGDSCPDGTDCHVVSGGTTCASLGPESAECQITSCEGDYYDIDGDYNTGCECDDTNSNNSCAAFQRLPADSNQDIVQGLTVSAVGRVPDGTSRDFYQVVFDANDASHRNGSAMPGRLRIYIDDPNNPGNPADQANTDVRFRVFEDTNGTGGCDPFMYTTPTNGGSVSTDQSSYTGQSTAGYATYWTFSDTCNTLNSSQDAGANAGNCPTSPFGLNGQGYSVSRPLAQRFWVEVLLKDGGTPSCDQYTIVAEWDTSSVFPGSPTPY